MVIEILTALTFCSASIALLPSGSNGDPSKNKSAGAQAAKAKSTSDKSELDALVGRVQKFYEDTKDFEAEFIQTYTRTALSRTSESRGTVKIKKPGMMRWDYSTPVAKHFIADGKQLVVYEPEDEVVTIQKSFKSSDLSSSLSFLLGEGKLMDSFVPRLLEEKSPEHRRIELTPKKDATYLRLVLLVERDSGRVLESTLFETAGNTNHFKFKNTKTNVGLDSKQFTFTPPAGAEVNVVP